MPSPRRRALATLTPARATPAARTRALVQRPALPVNQSPPGQQIPKYTRLPKRETGRQETKPCHHRKLKGNSRVSRPPPRRPRAPSHQQKWRLLKPAVRGSRRQSRRANRHRPGPAARRDADPESVSCLSACYVLAQKRHLLRRKSTPLRFRCPSISGIRKCANRNPVVPAR